MQFKLKNQSPELLLQLYKGLLKPRMLEEKMLVLLRLGKVSKWFSGIGQEAISVGLTAALEPTDYILPMHRNLGVFTGRSISLSRLLAQFQGKKTGFTNGRDRSFHFGTLEHRIIGMISHLGAQMGVADGIALGALLKKNKAVTAVFTGDGGASEGDFHEALNVAAVWDLPVIFVVENNGYGLSTPSSEQFRCKQFIDKAIGYGIEGIQVDGNNVLEVYEAVRAIASSMRANSRPVLFECMTFRMRGHEEASGTKYIPAHLLEIWGAKDPLLNFENALLEAKILDSAIIQKYREEIKTEIEAAVSVAFSEVEIVADTLNELNDVYAPATETIQTDENKNTEKRFIDAISDAMRQGLLRHENLILMGQDIAGYGGVFKASEGFLEAFGKERIRNTPLCESAILGAGLGLSIAGMKSIIEMQFADFITCGFNQVINNLAKTHYRWGQNADVVIRMPTGAGSGAGPFHSQSNEAWFFHTPGLKIVYPAFPYDAKGLLAAAIEDPNPVLFFEHKALYRSLSGFVPDGYYSLEIGKGILLKQGDDLTIVTYGMGVHWALETLDARADIKADLIDLRSLLPWDKALVEASVKKTGKLIILHEDTLTGGIGAEIAAHIVSCCFEFLDAPIIRSGSLDTPVPMAPGLENNFLPKNRFREQLVFLFNY
jgi:2-oxoisovalerate dehydrogenase E1 component